MDFPAPAFARPDYDTKATFERLTSKGFDLLYLCAYPIDGTRPARAEAQADEFVAVSKHYTTQCLGYAATAWRPYNPEDVHEHWDMIEYLDRAVGHRP
jgi:hypothetical protein